ncbi:MAG TPA: LCP family protein [Anaerolineae bacterium]|nr:LCP family protein [Anaerolineae bacterium]HQI86249.1 LCP family protein [Anaerolineae bacterium]
MASTESHSSLSRLPYALLINISLALIYLVLTAAAGYTIYFTMRHSVATSDILPEFTIKQTENESPNVGHVEGETLPVWTGTDRITVLILGIDERAQETDYWRTDTMILGTLDPVTMKAGVLSIPRDLWVHIPGYTEDRINTAHFIGDAYGHPGGGPALAVETVEYNLGVDIDYYVRFNFQAFIELVDRIGGIDIDVPETIHDTQYPTPDYGYETFHVDAGPHHFYGEEALKYARTRHSNGGDFDRARRQQQVIKAIFKRVTEANMLPQLAAQAPEMLQILEKSVKIDPKLKLNEIIALANLARRVNMEQDVTFRVIDERCTLFETTPGQAQILIPLRDEIRKVRDEVFGLANNGEKVQTLEEESATISVLNGTQTAGLAATTSQFLEANGLPVAAYDNADRQDYDTSLVILNRDKPMTAVQLLSLLKLPQSAVVNGNNPTAQYDIVIILGADYANGQ